MWDSSGHNMHQNHLCASSSAGSNGLAAQRFLHVPRALTSEPLSHHSQQGLTRRIDRTYSNHCWFMNSSMFQCGLAQISGDLKSAGTTREDWVLEQHVRAQASLHPVALHI